jgi:hypothetical protein
MEGAKVVAGLELKLSRLGEFSRALLTDSHVRLQPIIRAMNLLEQQSSYLGR